MRGRNRPVRSAVWSPPRGAVYTPGNANALFGMWFDGANDGVTAAKTDTLCDVAMDVYLAPGETQAMLLTDPASASKFAGALKSGDGADLSSSAGSPTVAVDGVTVATRNDLYSALSDGSAHTVTMAGAAVDDWSALCVGNYVTAGDWAFNGVIRLVSIVQNSDQSPIFSWTGDGNADANWTDPVGGNDGTVAGSPSKATSTDGGKTWSELT